MLTESTVRQEKRGLCSCYGSSANRKDDRLMIRISAEDKEKLKAVSEMKKVSMTDLIMNLLEVAYF